MRNLVRAPEGREQPPVLRGFEHIRRYWDNTHHSFAAKILPGEFYVTQSDEAVITSLGSCVSACIRDPAMGIAGMNHFMLPLQRGKAWSVHSALDSLANRYGNYAMEHMITDILKHGGRRKYLQVKIFGGSRVLNNVTAVGDSNIRFVRNFLQLENIEIIAEDVGGINPRKIFFFPESGKVMVKKIRDIHNDTIARRESAYMDSLDRQPDAGAVDIFG